MPNDRQRAIIRHLFTRGQPLLVPKGEIVLGNEPEPNGVYYISSGFIKIYSVSDTGQENLHIVYGPGELFPLIWAYLGIEPESLYHQALSDCTLWRLSRDWFQHFIKHNAPVSYAVSLQLAYQFSIYSDRVDNLEYKKASERVAYRLLFLAYRFGKKSNGRITIDAPITHEVFANSINLARESVSREMETLEHERIIEKPDRVIVIRDIKRLAERLSRPVNLTNWHLV